MTGLIHVSNDDNGDSDGDGDDDDDEAWRCIHLSMGFYFIDLVDDVLPTRRHAIIWTYFDVLSPKIYFQEKAFKNVTRELSLKFSGN